MLERELIRLDSQTLEHADEQIRQRIIPLSVKDQMLAVLESAAGEQDRQVVVAMGVGVAHARSLQNRGLFEERAAAVGAGLQRAEKLAEDPELSLFHLAQGFDYFGTAAMVCQIVMAGGAEVMIGPAVLDVQGDDAAGIGHQRQAGDVVHQLAAPDGVVKIGVVDRRRHVDLGLGLLLPLGGHGHALFQIADRGEVFVETVAVSRPDLSIEAAGTIGRGVEHAASLAQLLDAGGDFAGLTLEEHLLEHKRGSVLRGDHHSGPGPGKAQRLGADSQIQIGQPRGSANFLGRELIERNRIAKTALTGMRRRGEKDSIGFMSTIDAGMREAGEDGEVLAKCL